MKTKTKANKNHKAVQVGFGASLLAFAVNSVFKQRGVKAKKATQAADAVGAAILRGQPGVSELVQAARKNGLLNDSDWDSYTPPTKYADD